MRRPLRARRLFFFFLWTFVGCLFGRGACYPIQSPPLLDRQRSLDFPLVVIVAVHEGSPSFGSGGRAPSQRHYVQPLPRPADSRRLPGSPLPCATAGHLQKVRRCPPFVRQDPFPQRRAAFFACEPISGLAARGPAPRTPGSSSVPELRACFLTRRQRPDSRRIPPAVGGVRLPRSCS